MYLFRNAAKEIVIIKIKIQERTDIQTLKRVHNSKTVHQQSVILYNIVLPLNKLISPTPNFTDIQTGSQNAHFFLSEAQHQISLYHN